MANASLQGCTGSVRETMDDSRKALRASKKRSGIENLIAGVAGAPAALLRLLESVSGI